MTFIDDISSSLAAVQSQIASVSSGSPPASLGDGFAAILASMSSATDQLGTLGGDGTPGLAGGALGASPSSTSALGSLSSGLTGDPSAASAVTGAAVVADASKYLGVPYKWGGTDPSVGLDCSGLVQLTYKDLGISLPRGAADQARMGTPVASLADAQPGDLVAFGTPVEHIGIYAGNGMMVVAPHTGAQVRYEKISVTPSAIRRIVPSDASGIGGLGSISGLSEIGGVSSLAGLSDPSGLGGLSGLSGLSGIGGVTGLAGLTGNAGLTGTAGLLSTAGATPGPASGPYADLFNTAGAKYGINPQVLSAVAHAESNYTPTETSSAGAQGLMQLMPGTASSLGVNALDPAQAVDGAARMLSGLLQRFGNLPEALAAYNAGSGAVARYGGIPPYPETRAYVSRVLGYINQESA